MHGFETMAGGRMVPQAGALNELLRSWRHSGEDRDGLRLLLVGWGLFEADGCGLRATEAGRRLAELLKSSESVPGYDALSRRLSWRGGVVKTLAREAACQEAVLLAFQQAGWPALLDDPLEVEAGVDVKARLRQTVKSLNKRLRPGTIRFHADGTGRAVRWAVVQIA